MIEVLNQSFHKYNHICPEVHWYTLLCLHCWFVPVHNSLSMSQWYLQQVVLMISEESRLCHAKMFFNWYRTGTVVWSIYRFEAPCTATMTGTVPIPQRTIPYQGACEKKTRCFNLIGTYRQSFEEIKNRHPTKPVTS